MSLPRIVGILLFKESRKTAFGIWIVALATTLLALTLIKAEHWVAAVAISAGLVSGGAVWEKYIETKNGTPPVAG